MVRDLAALDRYRWAGHSVLLRKHCNRWQAVEAVLGQFSRRVGEARQRYRQFGAEGRAQGRPVGVALDRKGGLLVADDVGNTVWRVSAQR